MMQNQPPVHTLRYGSVQAAIWKNKSEQNESEYFSVTLSRRFRQGDDWKDSKAFLKSDLPTVSKIAGDAHSWIQEQAAAKEQDAEFKTAKMPRAPRRGRAAGTDSQDLAAQG